MNKQCLIVLLAATSCVFVSAQGRYHILMGDPFYDMSWVDSMMTAQQQMMDSFTTRFESFGPPKEEREILKQARETLAKITHEVKEENSTVTITFNGFTSLSKEDVKVVKKDNGWLGTITLKEGRIEFFISPIGFQVSSRMELRKEEKADKDKKEGEGKQAERTFYTSQSATQAEFFSSAVDLSTLKAEPVKPTEFRLAIQKQKEEILPLS